MLGFGISFFVVCSILQASKQMTDAHTAGRIDRLRGVMLDRISDEWLTQQACFLCGASRNPSRAQGAPGWPTAQRRHQLDSKQIAINYESYARGWREQDEEERRRSRLAVVRDVTGGHDHDMTFLSSDADCYPALAASLTYILSGGHQDVVRNRWAQYTLRVKACLVLMAYIKTRVCQDFGSVSAAREHFIVEGELMGTHMDGSSWSSYLGGLASSGHILLCLVMRGVAQ